MSKTRLSKGQKKSILLIYLLEGKFDKHVAVNTGFLRRKVEAQLNAEKQYEIKLQPNHFLVSLKKLAQNDYLVYQQNIERLINSSAKENENMWQLTNKGRMYAEAYLSASLCPKRRYTKRK